MAKTCSPTRTLSESPHGSGLRSCASILQDGHVDVRVGADHGGGKDAVVLQLHLDRLGLVDDVAVGDDQAVLSDDDAGAVGDLAERGGLVVLEGKGGAVGLRGRG